METEAGQRAVEDAIDCAVKSLGIGNNVVDEVKKWNEKVTLLPMKAS